MSNELTDPIITNQTDSYLLQIRYDIYANLIKNATDPNSKLVNTIEADQTVANAANPANPAIRLSKIYNVYNISFKKFKNYIYH